MQLTCVLDDDKLTCQVTYLRVGRLRARSSPDKAREAPAGIAWKAAHRNVRAHDRRRTHSIASPLSPVPYTAGPGKRTMRSATRGPASSSQQEAHMRRRRVVHRQACLVRRPHAATGSDIGGDATKIHRPVRHGPCDGATNLGMHAVMQIIRGAEVGVW
jgi:hypothetical protein